MTFKKPLFERKGIPFYVEKSEQDFQKDPYERFDPMVRRQTALHLSDQLWGYYPYASVLHYAQSFYQKKRLENILEVGCGVGRWIAHFAQVFPDARCCGLDFSYQMLKRAKEYWIEGKMIDVDATDKGLERLQIQVEQPLRNLSFGLAKASQLPIRDNSLDLVCSSFLLDRLAQPEAGMKEMYRSLRTGGLLLLVSPLNFQQKLHWQQFYPPERFGSFLQSLGYSILLWEENISIKEPIDRQGNMLNWNCLKLVAQK